MDHLTLDSRSVKNNSLFAAIPGTQVDGHQYISEAVDRGANVVVCEKLPQKLSKKITYVKVDNSAAALGHIACNFYDHPSRQLKLVGVTGTNGKTTTVYLLYQMLRALGYNTGMLTTIHYSIGEQQIKATHTTPHAIVINELLHKMVQHSCTFCVMEVSSHALSQNRTTGLNFDGALFTNITREHLDYHKTFDNYFKAKKILFDDLSADTFALVNADDNHSSDIVEDTQANTYTFGLQHVADYKGKMLENTFSGLKLDIDGEEVHTPLVGGFNAYNIVATYGVGRLLSFDKREVLQALTKAQPVEGRFDYIRGEAGVIGIVDYAHSPDALKQVLQTINEVRTHQETLITVAGCGGDRDREKRPIMGRVASKLSDKVILTSDNPRSEDPGAIIETMKEGITPADQKKVISITDRREAIKTACAMANEKDIVLVAGKGHEKYQVINGEKRPFDDKALLQQFLKDEITSTKEKDHS